MIATCSTPPMSDYDIVNRWQMEDAVRLGRLPDHRSVREPYGGDEMLLGAQSDAGIMRRIDRGGRERRELDDLEAGDAVVDVEDPHGAEAPLAGDTSRTPGVGRT